jgi:hypothetical protein
VNERLAETYRKRRKDLNQNLGLLIALAASCAAIWTGYEARHTRLEAGFAAKDSLDVQHKAVQAQIDTMRLDERPYIRVGAVGVKRTDEADPDEPDYYRAAFKLIAVGRTPATFLKWNVRCSLLQANQLTGTALTEKEARTRSNETLLILGESDLTRATNSEAVLNSAESIEVECPFSKKDYLAAKDDVEYDEHTKTFDDKSNMMTFIVDVLYSDVFDAKHRTEQCFYVPVGTSPTREKLLPCHQFKPVID